MAGIDKLRTNNYAEYNEFRLWCLRNNPRLLMDFYEPFLSYGEWNQLQKRHGKNSDHVEDTKLIIAHFLSDVDKYLFWRCPLDFIRDYLKGCGHKHANWFVKLFWKY